MPFRAEAFSYCNQERAKKWHKDGTRDWSIAEWTNALCGEAGEAANKAKKLLRIELNTKPRDSEKDREKIINELAKELADVVIYADLIADQIGINLWQAVCDKWNQTSIEQGFENRFYYIW